MIGPLVLSLFPGIGLLDRAFEEEGFCIVRGPDVLWGGDIKRFHPPAGRFDGVIAGVPCQHWSPLVHMVRHTHGESAVAEDMFPEFQRVAGEARPTWFLTECSPFAPIPVVSGYGVTDLKLDNRWIGDGIGGVQRRKRRFCFGTAVHRVSLDVSANLALFEAFESETAVTGDARPVPVAVGGSGKPKSSRVLDVSPDLALFENLRQERAVIASGAKEGEVIRLDKGNAKRPAERRQTLPGNLPRRSIEECCELQGLPRDFLEDAPFTKEGKYQVIGNGVPLPMGRAIARAVKRAMHGEAVTPHPRVAQFTHEGERA